jgi:hypothetical protein
MNEHVPADAPLKKRHAGYAFIVFEREKDMKGTVSTNSFAKHPLLTQATL